MLTQAILVILINIVLVRADIEFVHQPQLLTHDRNIIVEAALDKNITLRMVGDAAALMVNDVNILDTIKKRFSSNLKLNEDNVEGSEILTSDAIVLQIKTVKRDLQRLSYRLSNTENRTRVSYQSRRLRRLLGRVSRVFLRLAVIENRLAENDCVEKQPCKNGGICYDLYKNFYCECPEGWTGKSCEDDVDECYMWTGTDLGCQNNAVCINTLGSYRCNCTSGYSGTHCRLRNAVCDSAQSSELCGQGVCVPANNALGYSCLCNQGWSRENITMACTADVNECEESRNPCHSTCINLPGSFKCGPCPQGFTGNGMTCLDINECAQNNGGCSMMPRVQCINSEGSYHCGNCPPGWLGDGHRCEKAQSNSCDAEGICHSRAKCVYISDIVVCTCQPGWYGHGFGNNGCLPGANAGNLCENHECKNNATCIVSGRGTRCICPLGFSGPLCETNEACNPNPCRNGGTCNLLPGNKYRCSCPRGTTGNNCEILRNTCGSIINQEAGELTYPPDGGSYEPNERCAWIIRTASTKVLNVTFSKFDLEEYTDCGKDWLQIHDGRSLAAQLIGRFCGNSLPLGGNFLSSHQQLFLWFRSDNATNGSGLKMSWTSQEHTCGGELNVKLNDNGVIRSPGYPGKTPANRECEWRFTAPYNARLIFRIYEVILGGKNENCTGDLLKIYDSDQVLERICETKLPEPKHTSSNFVRVHFHTDSYGADSSFQMHYEVVLGDPNCGGLYTDTSGVFGGDVGAGICLYLIQQPVGTKIKLDFPQRELVSEITPKTCFLHMVEIFDGKTDEAPLIKKFCPGDSIQSITSSSNYLLVRYKFMVRPREGHIFQAKYSQACDESFFGPDGGIFATPNYPNPYYDHITCTYNIYGPLDTVVHVNFTDFSISETIPDMSEDAQSDVNVVKKDRDVDDFANYVDVYISNDAKRRYYKGEAMHLVSSKNRMRIVFHSSVNQRKSRGLRVEYSFETINCGGVLTENEGSFSKYELSESLAPYCEWVLEAPEGKQIKLDLLYSRSGAKCAPGDSDLLIFMNSSTSGDHLVGSYCDEERRISTTFHHNLITIKLKKIPIEQKGHINYGLTANYTFVDNQSECGGNFSYGFGVIKTPAWPQKYPVQMDCTWLITAPLGHKIELVVQNFSLEVPSIYKCSEDYLEIRDGQTSESPLIGRYCGLSIPNRLPSFSNHLRLHFHSDLFISEDGFYITWEQTATGCGGKLNSHIGSIHSPHYPEISAGAVVCDWQITVAQGSRVIVMVTPTQANADLCQNDVLSIYDGPNMLSRVLAFNCSATQNTIELRSSSHQVAVRYVLADGAQNGQQFLLEYKTDCVRQINDLQGVIESPNFPENYPPLLQCAWDIRGGRNNKIAITFSHLTFEASETGCKYDYLDVIDMRDDKELKTHHLCHRPTDILQSEGNRLLLKFYSDYNNSPQGFHAEFKRIGCGEHLQQQHGSIQSPNAPYSVDVDCDWFIDMPVGWQIVLTIEELHIETESHDCSDDVLTVSNEKDSVFNLLKECQISQKTIVTSMANRMYVHFHTSAKRARKYFKATYTTKNSATCGGIFLGKQGLITSPNYPDHYSPSSVCVWSISAEETYGIEFNFDHFDLPTSDKCQDTFLQFKHFNANESDTRQLCGSQIPARTTTYNNQLEIYFQAGTLPPLTGFALRYKAQCGGSLTEATGYIKSSMGENCTWLIEAVAGAHISLNILHLECPCGNSSSSSSNCTDGVLIMSDKYGRNYDTLCAAHPVNIFSAGRTMLIQTYNVYFRASYSSVQNSCGGILTSLEGQLASPYYPNTYPSNIECIWEIKTTKSNAIELNFDMLNITSSEFCNQDFLEIRSSEGGSLLGIYCSSTLPLDTLTSYEIAWIKFRSVEGSTGAGFYLRWNYAHIISINDTEGVIESPPVYSVRKQAEPYLWRVTVPRGNLISLSFKEYHKGLFLYDGFDEVALAIDIQYSPWEFMSSSNVVLLKSSNSEMELFKIEWKAVSKNVVKANKTITDCHEDIVLPFNAHVSLSSPGYPKEYPNGLNCDWIITLADPTQHAVLNLLDADLEDVTNCPMDYLLVSSSSNLREWHQELHICRNQPLPKLPAANIHGTPNLKLNFRSDNSISGRGFNSVLTTACGSNMTGPVGTILYPHLLQSRIFNYTCLWHIEVRAGRRIEFTFNFGARTIKPTEVCEHYAIIYDGVDDNAPFLEPGQICNRVDRKVSTLMSTTNHAIVKYNMSWSLRDDVMNLWNLTFREFNDCGGEIVLTYAAKSVNISTPHYPNVPHPHTECAMVVLAPAGESIQVEFVDRFDMNARYCSQEYVEFFDGSTELAKSMGRYCTKPDTLHTTGNALYIHYQTAVSEPRNGFRINVSIALCGGTFSLTPGEISSSAYPAIGAYPAQTNCDYRIKVSTFSRVKLTFNDIHLPFDALNLNVSDHLEIYALYSESPDDAENDTQPFAILYGNVTQMPVLELDSNEVLIRFKTFRPNHQYRGFKLKYERTHNMCLKDVTGESGILTLGGIVYSMSYIICRWKITVPKGQSVRLEFLNMPQRLPTMESSMQTTPRYSTRLSVAHTHSFSTSSAMITVYNNHLMQSLLTKFDVNTYNASQVIQSSDNVMLVRIQFSPSMLSVLKNLRARYSSDEDSSCPTDINDQNSGTISLQQLTLDGKNFYCKVSFTMKAEETLAFSINELRTKLPLSYRQSTAVRFQNNELYVPLERLNTNLTNTLVAISTKRGSVIFMQNELVKILKFSANYRRHRCGGQLRLSDGLVIETPNIEEVGYGSLDCAWVLDGDIYSNGYRLLGNASLSWDCEDEYIKIYASSSLATPPIATFCRDSAPFNITILNRFTTLVYHVLNYKVRASHFSFLVEKALTCGRTEDINSELGKSIVVDAKTYRNNMECSWEFKAVKGFYLTVSFPGRVFIEESVNCTKDYLEIQRFESGIWQSGERLCGRVVPPNKNFTTNQLRIIFRTDAAITADGFKLQVTPTCNVSFNVTSATHIISSPLFLSMQTHKIQCIYKFFSDTDKRMNVRIVDHMRLGTLNRCEFFSITTYKRSDDVNSQDLIEMGKYCGEAELGGRNFLQLNLHAIMEKYIRIEFELDACGGSVTGPTILRSLNSDDGESYANNMNCVWNVTAPADHSIALLFKYFEMEKNDECRYDYLAIYSGPLVLEEKRTSKLCGNLTGRLPPVIMVDSNQAIIEAISDESSTYKGFLAELIFTQNCNERIALTDGNSPVTLVRHLAFQATEVLFCQYNIMALVGYRVRVEIKDLKLGCALDDCERCNHIVAIDSVEAQRSSLGKYCATGRSQVSLLSSFEDMVLKVSATQPGNYSFEIVLEMEQSMCGGRNELLLDVEPLILRFPAHNSAALYPPNAHCTWLITSKSEFQIEFDEFALQNASQVTGKCLDYLKIKTHYMSQDFCGNITGYKMLIPKFVDAIADITFHSDALVESKGFQLTIGHRRACNRTYTATSGLISYSRPYRDYGVCLDEIRVPIDYTLAIYEYGFNLYMDQQNCSKYYVKVIDIVKNETLEMFCRFVYSTKNVLTTTNAVRLVYTTNQLRLFYVATKKPASPGCGGDIYTSEGVIENPPYHQDHNKSECRWNIVVPAPNKIRLIFYTFDMGSTINCALDYLSLIEVGADNSEQVVQTYCGQDVPTGFISQHNHVAVLAKKSQNFDGVGFRLRFETHENPIELNKDLKWI